MMKKLTSRKFLVSAIATVAGLITLFAGNNQIVQVIAGALMAIVPTVTYCITEGRIDAASVKVVTDTAVDAAAKLGATATTTSTISAAGTIVAGLADDDEKDNDK